jgi:hypothetical protein
MPVAMLMSLSWLRAVLQLVAGGAQGLQFRSAGDGGGDHRYQLTHIHRFS